MSKKNPPYYVLREWKAKSVTVIPWIYDSLLEAVTDAECQVPSTEYARIQEQFSEITEHDGNGDIISNHYYVKDNVYRL
jgi:hypothetical protein